MNISILEAHFAQIQDNHNIKQLKLKREVIKTHSVFRKVSDLEISIFTQNRVSSWVLSRKFREIAVTKLCRH